MKTSEIITKISEILSNEANNINSTNESTLDACYNAFSLVSKNINSLKIIPDLMDIHDEVVDCVASQKAEFSISRFLNIKEKSCFSDCYDDYIDSYIKDNFETEEEQDDAYYKANDIQAFAEEQNITEQVKNLILESLENYVDYELSSEEAV